MIYYREQKHICGKSYDEARYMEIDLYPVTERQHKAGSRQKRQHATSLAMQAYNEKQAKRYHVQLVNTNFSSKDFSWTATYNDEHLPDPEDRERVDRDFGNFIKRLYRFCDQRGIRRPRWVAATEYSTEQDNGVFVGRHHHHAIIEHTEGLTRDDLENLWSERKEKLGLCRCEYLEVNHGSVESLVKYISKNKRCDRHWRQSRGLEKPKRPQPNDTKWSRKRFEDAATLYIDDREFWAKQYPGYTLERVETMVSDAGQRHTVVILYREGAPKKRNKKPCT